MPDLDLPPGALRVKLLASPINPADINYIQGVYGIRPALPATGGLEGCGEVVETNNAGFAKGDKVIFIQAVGAWSQSVVVAGDAVLKIPSHTPSKQAAMLKVNPLTALCMLQEIRSLPEGSWIAQNAANSGVGCCIIQIAKLLGLRTINFVRRESLIQPLIQRGADGVFLDTKEGFEEAKKAVEGHPVYLGLNAVGGDSALRLMDFLAKGATHVTYGAMSRRSLKVPNSFLLFRGLSLRGFWVTQWMGETPKSTIEKAYAQLADWMIQGALEQPIEAVYGLEDFQTALAHAQQEKRSGKILFTF